MNVGHINEISVLVIDDDNFEQKILTTILKNIGVNRSEVAGGGQAALDRLRDNDVKIDIALCDLRMPDIDGLEFVRVLSQFVKAPAIIFVSGADITICRAAEKIATQLGLSVLGSILKPPDPLELAKLIGTYFEKKVNPTYKTPSVVLSPDNILAGLNRDAIGMYYQPKIDVNSFEIAGFEALARWHDNAYGVLGPATFIPTIESCGLLNSFTEVVIKRTMSDLASWANLAPLVEVSINVAAENLSNLKLPQQIMASAKKYGISPSRITLEMTESGVTNDLTAAMEILTRLRLNEIRLSVDDFGTGYASLDKLKDLPFNELKIDRGFVQGAENNESALALLELACELGQKLRLDIVAEGVETSKQWELVKQLGCDTVQGFFIEKPMPASDVPQWIESWPEKARLRLFGQNPSVSARSIA